MINVQYELKRIKEKLYLKIVWALPRQFVMWCGIRVLSFATVGKYENTNVGELTVLEALKRWEQSE